MLWKVGGSVICMSGSGMLIFSRGGGGQGQESTGRSGAGRGSKSAGQGTYCFIRWLNSKLIILIVVTSPSSSTVPRMIQGVSLQKVPPIKVLSMELVPLNRIKSPSTLVPAEATREAKNNQNRRFLTLQWCSAVVFKHYTIFSLFIRLQTCDTGHSKLPSLKNSTSHSNAGLSLVFHLPHSSSDHALLVVVDVINHMFSLTEELVKGVRHWVINLGLKQQLWHLVALGGTSVHSDFILLRGTNSILRTFLGGSFRKKHPVYLTGRSV